MPGTDLLQIETPFLFLLLVRILASAYQTLREYEGTVLSSARTLPAVTLVAFILLGFFSAILAGVYDLDVPLAIGLSLGFLLSLLSPIYATSFFTSLLLLRPWELLEKNDFLLAAPRTYGLLCFAVLIFHRVRRARFRIAWDKNIAVFVAVAAWFMLSSLKGFAGVSGLPVFLDIFLKAAIVFFVLIHSVELPRDVDLMRDCLLISGAGVITLALYQAYQSDLPMSRLTAVGILENSNDLAALVVLILPLGLRSWLVRKRPNALMLLGTLGYLGICLTAIAYSQSRGAILATVAMAGLWLLTHLKSRRLAGTLIALLLLALVPAQALLQRQETDTRESTASRLLYWKTGLKMAVRNPVLGVGFGNYPNLFESYADDLSMEWGKRTAHSTWILALAETGFPGFFGLVTLFFLGFRAAMRIYPRFPELGYSLVGYTMTISFLSHTYLLYPYILLALIFSADRVERVSRGNLNASM